MPKVSLDGLATLVAFKMRADNLSAVKYCGIKRALVEVIFDIRIDAASQLRAAGFAEAATKLDEIAARDHTGDTERTRLALLGALELRDPGGEHNIPVDASEIRDWPKPDSNLAYVLAAKDDVTNEAFEERLVKLGRKVAERISDHPAAPVRKTGT